MFVLLLVAVLWSGVHAMDIPDDAPHFRGAGRSLIKNPEPLSHWSASSIADGQRMDTQRHAQRVDAWPGR